MKIAQLNPREFEKFRRFIYEHTGIKIGDRKISLLSNRIRRRLKACGFDDFRAYYRFLTSHQTTGELEHFLDAITTNETSFFRTATHFQWLNSSFLPQVVDSQRAGRRAPSLRFWSAACASGAEPFSIAICLAENRFRLRDWSLTVLGTDLSEQQLEKARAGIFHSRQLNLLSTVQRRRFLQPIDDDLWQVKSEIRESVTFARHNLMQPMKGRLFDCIFLCNVLIYFDQTSKRTVLDNMTGALATGGFLIVGPSEGLFEASRGLTRHSPCIYQKT